MNPDIPIALKTRTALALVDVLGIFTSEIDFRTPKIQSSDVLWLPHKILHVR